MKISAIHTPYDGLEVWVDGEILSPKPSQKVISHSPDGFSAGYLGSGVAQLALAILLKATDKQTALLHYQSFKEEFLADPCYLDHGFSFEVDIHEWLSTRQNSI